MLSKPLLATLLAAAPSGLWAFEDMDCIGTEYCTDEGCATSAQIFAVDFDWSASAVDLSFGSTLTLRLDLLRSAGPATAATGNLAFAQPDGDATLLLDVFEDRIEAAVTVDAAGLYLGQCTAREAA